MKVHCDDSGVILNAESAQEALILRGLARVDITTDFSYEVDENKKFVVKSAELIIY